MDLNLNFNITTDSAFSNKSYTNKEHIDFMNIFSNFISDSRNVTDMNYLFETCIPVLNYSYVLECLNGERNIERDQLNIEDVEAIVNDRSIIKITDRERIKIKNMNNAVKLFFPDPFNLKFNPATFTEDLAKQMHIIIGADELICDAGNYRTKPAKPARCDYEYANFGEIEERMKRLFKGTRTRLLDDLSLEERVKLGAKFLSAFLDIHPFSNGNGRVSRLLLSYMLSSSCVVPITLFVEKGEKDNYIRSLVESQSQNPTFGPLAEYILVSIRYDIEKYLLLLDIWDEFLVYFNA